MPYKRVPADYRIEVVCVGSELLLDRVNTDINILSEILGRTGFCISGCRIAGDHKAEIIRAIGSSMERSRIIFVTGGLGPTSDDITRESIAELLGRKLVFSKETWESIRGRFCGRGITKIPEINKKQAYIIEGSSILQNETGTAPGLIIKEGKKTIVALPGPPAELAPMAEKYAESLRSEGIGKALSVYRFGISGVPESAVEEAVNPFLSTCGIKYTILAQPQMIEILIVAERVPEKQIQETENIFRETFGDGYLGLNPPPLPEIVGTLLCKKGWKLALAESCTGGLAGKLLTDIPGSSDFFQGSFVTYADVLKKRILKVPKTVLKKYGAVSGETAICMAKGAMKAGKSDISLSFTGIAGPSGGTVEKPVGLVFIGIGLPENRFYAHRFIFHGGRQTIRERTVYQGLDILRKCLNESSH